MFNQEKNMILSDKERIENEIYLNVFNLINKQYLSSNIPNESITLPLNIHCFNPNEAENISLEEVKNIMNETKINLDEDECEEIYFNKKHKTELQSIDSSTKMNTMTDNRENREEKSSKTISFKTFTNQKRGRKVKKENNKLNRKIHGSADFDNIQRKIQVSFITFLIRFGNDALKSIFGKNTKYNFKDLNYKLKKKVNHDYIESLKQCSYSDIIKMKISPKNKKFGEDANKETFNEICKYSDTLKKLFEKNYLYIFQNYYCNLKNEANIDGIKIKLSPKTKTLFNLLEKNKSDQDKFKVAINDVYFSQNNYNLDNKFIISSNEQ